AGREQAFGVGRIDGDGPFGLVAGCTADVDGRINGEVTAVEERAVFEPFEERARGIGPGVAAGASLGHAGCKPHGGRSPVKGGGWRNVSTVTTPPARGNQNL